MKKLLLSIILLLGFAACGTSNDSINVVTREQGSGTRGAFIELFNLEKKIDGKKIDLISKEAMVENSTNTVITDVSNDVNAIGYISMGAINNKIKTLKIDGVLPTNENIENGSYKIYRPFNIAIKKGNNNLLLKDFINYILSENGQKIVSKYYIPVVSNSPEFISNNSKGTLVIGGSSSVSPLMEKLIEDYMKINTNANIQLQTNDSTTGMTKTIEGAYNIGMASRELKNKEKNELENIVISLDGIAIIVNSENKLDNISKEMVTDIYLGDVVGWHKIKNKK